MRLKAPNPERACDVEKAMYTTFNQVKAINPKITTIMVRSNVCVSRLQFLTRVLVLLCALLGNHHHPKKTNEKMKTASI